MWSPPHSVKYRFSPSPPFPPPYLCYSLLVPLGSSSHVPTSGKAFALTTYCPTQELPSPCFGAFKRSSRIWRACPTPSLFNSLPLYFSWLQLLQPDSVSLFMLSLVSSTQNESPCSAPNSLCLSCHLQSTSFPPYSGKPRAQGWGPD